MKRLITAILIISMVCIFSGTSQAASKFYWATGLTGGGAALDGIDGAGLAAGDAAIVILDSGTNQPLMYVYRLQASSAALSSPTVIRPTANAGTGSWHLSGIVIDGTQGIAIGPTGVLITSDLDGAITFAGKSTGFDETLTFNLDDTDNTVVVTSSGTAIDFSALNLVTSGTIQGKLNIITTDITLDAAQVYGSVIVMSGGAETATLPAAVVGMNVLFYASASGVKNINPNGTDTIVLTTAALTAGYQIESPGAVGDFIALVCLAANQWTAMGRSGVWITHGAD
jgi:hypothetical protein